MSAAQRKAVSEVLLAFAKVAQVLAETAALNLLARRGAMQHLALATVREGQMLKGLNPLLNPDLLKVLAEMGHGDEITIADANFPGTAIAKNTVSGQVLRIDSDALTALRAVLSVFPLDTFEDEPVTTMQVVGEPDSVPEVVAEAQPILAAEGFRSKSVERFAFYEHAKRSYAVLMTLEGRPYGNFILRKGVIFTG